MKCGDTVQIKESDSIFDCCAGKRGRVTHEAVGGGWLLVTDHFCPIARHDEDVEVIAAEVLAQELLDSRPKNIVDEYKAASTAMLWRYADHDQTAAAVLILRQAVRRPGECYEEGEMPAPQPCRVCGGGGEIEWDPEPMVPHGETEVCHACGGEGAASGEENEEDEDESGEEVSGRAQQGEHRLPGISAGWWDAERDDVAASQSPDRFQSVGPGPNGSSGQQRDRAELAADPKGASMTQIKRLTAREERLARLHLRADVERDKAMAALELEDMDGYRFYRDKTRAIVNLIEVLIRDDEREGG